MKLVSHRSRPFKVRLKKHGMRVVRPGENTVPKEILEHPRVAKMLEEGILVDPDAKPPEDPPEDSPEDPPEDPPDEEPDEDE